MSSLLQTRRLEKSAVCSGSPVLSGLPASFLSVKLKIDPVDLTCIAEHLFCFFRCR